MNKLKNKSLVQEAEELKQIVKSKFKLVDENKKVLFPKPIPLTVRNIRDREYAKKYYWKHKGQLKPAKIKMLDVSDQLAERIRTCLVRKEV